MEEFKKLRNDFESLKKIVLQMNDAKVSVEWVSYEVAEVILDCSRTTIWRLCKKGEIATENRGRSVRFSLQSIRLYLKSKQYTPEIVEARINSVYSA